MFIRTSRPVINALDNEMPCEIDINSFASSYTRLIIFTELVVWATTLIKTGNAVDLEVNLSRLTTSHITLP